MRQDNLLHLIVLTWMDNTSSVKVIMTVHFLKWWRWSIIFLRQVCLHNQVVILTCFIILSASLVLLIGLRCWLFMPTLNEIAFHSCWCVREWPGRGEWCVLVITRLMTLTAMKGSSYISTVVDLDVRLVLRILILPSFWRTDIQLSLKLWVSIRLEYVMTTFLSLLKNFFDSRCNICLRNFLRVQFLYLRTEYVLFVLLLHYLLS